MASLHYRYGGSSIGAVLLCRARGKAAEFAGPDIKEKGYAEQGTVAHSLLERAITKDLRDVYFLVGLGEEGEDIDEDMARNVKIAIDYVKDATDKGAMLIAESLLPFPSFPDIAGGTADIRLYYPDGTVEIVDFKYGFDPVEADCAQNKFYAVCATGDYPRDVVLTIIQPRAFHADGPIRSTPASKQELIDFRKQVEIAILEAEADNAPHSPSAEACRYCPKAGVCAALEQASLEVMGLSNVRNLAKGKGVLPKPDTLSIDRLSQILAAEGMVKEWLRAVERRAFAEAMNGENIGGHKLVHKKPARSFPQDVPPQEVAQRLAEMCGAAPETFLATKVVSLAEAETQMARHMEILEGSSRGLKKRAVDRVNMVVVRAKDSKLTLVPMSDRREAVSRGDNTFAGINVNLNTNTEKAST